MSLLQDPIFHDGRIYQEPKDAPGQLCIYIPPGDVRKEAYRLSTFRRFPASTTPVAPALLARAGFHYTGYNDRVKCFSCCVCVENWTVGDDAADKRWHLSNCDFANGRATQNEPLVGIYKRQLALFQQRNSLLNHGATNVPTSSQLTISSGNFTQGNIIRPQTSTQSSRQQQNAISTLPLDQRYPCRDPVNSYMRSPASRLETFQSRNGSRWPSERLRAGINDLVEAGFFFLGERDRVKCWYCNGGLQNWDYDDDPWTEHAKWFPSCHFLLRTKGPDFVDNVVARYPNLNRPVPAVISRPPTPPEPMSSSPPPILTPAQAVENAMTSLGYVKQARDMGYSDEIIKRLLMKKHEANGEFYSRPEAFLEALFLTESQQNETPQPQTSVASASGETPSHMLSKLRELEETALCKNCRKEKSNVVIIPCGHLAACENCSLGLRRCPVCNKIVQKIIKTFRA